MAIKPRHYLAFSLTKVGGSSYRLVGVVDNLLANSMIALSVMATRGADR